MACFLPTPERRETNAFDEDHLIKHELNFYIKKKQLSYDFLVRVWIRCMNVDEARGVCNDLSRWCSVVSAYPHGKKA